MNKDSMTYVLFGKEAINVYKISIVQLCISRDIKYTIGKFRSIKKFKDECDKWDDFIEIIEEDYIKIKKHFKKNKLVNGMPKEKKSFLGFFKFR